MKAIIALALMQSMCPGKSFSPGKWMESDQGGPHITYSRKELGEYSQNTQKFIIYHECGHTHGIGSETKADTYAFHKMKVTKSMIDEICRKFETVDEARPRCANLRKLYNDDNAGR